MADLSAKLKQNPDDTEAIKSFIGDEGEKQSVLFNEQEIEAANDRLADRIKLMAHSGMCISWFLASSRTSSNGTYKS